ncbi:Glycosyltransferase involved in cell wall bisynthesis [Ectothiorhodosinus mongolicus]|uniref:Glycosyltransferase involved in cell wall bisynthesis n=1 Tax=Ectothiorhodosinus mongolicus TaxID=233100 RepID=A0A1R3W5Y5_9GAMM|nr:glycosyltransferase [Ectothiorhodosinus mongolicus]ULX57603.1 glycosyl transferase family 2 [Ectothiorhodosinus mongolicus]SIT73060.1 Glycosyltransferase involved in cell wall bisynthesis [Ectothiorhodosinus mongolicus]
MSAAPIYSVIIPAWNEAGWIEKSLEAVFAACHAQPESFEVIVVDNNSSDDTAELARAAGAKVVFEPHQQIARARNAGAQAAQGQWLIFVDADTWPEAALIRATLDQLASGAVSGGGAQVDFDDLPLAIYRLGLRLWNFASYYGGVAAGCYLFCQAAALKEIGGFSEKVYAGEEAFFSRGIRRWGKARGLKFHIIRSPKVLTSGRKTQWFAPWQHVMVALTVLLMPFVIRSKRLSWFWYRRPPQ